MLKKVLSISGKPGLFKMVSQGKNMYIVESLADKKRVPIYPKDKVVSLGDIAIYTETEEVPLSTVLSSVFTKEKGAAIEIKSNIQPAELRAYFSQILPDYDKERVYPSDMKKIMGWYNILVASGMTDFENKEANTTESEEKAITKEKTAKKPEKEKTKDKSVKVAKTTEKPTKSTKTTRASKTTKG